MNEPHFQCYVCQKIFLRCTICNKSIKAFGYDYNPPKSFLINGKAVCYSCFDFHCNNLARLKSVFKKHEMQDETPKQCPCNTQNDRIKSIISKEIDNLRYRINDLPRTKETCLALDRLDESFFWLNEAFKKMKG